MLVVELDTTQTNVSVNAYAVRRLLTGMVPGTTSTTATSRYQVPSQGTPRRVPAGNIPTHQTGMVPYRTIPP